MFPALPIVRTIQVNRSTLLAGWVLVTSFVLGCQDNLQTYSSSVDAYRARMLGSGAEPDMLVAAADLEPARLPNRNVRDALLAEPLPASQPTIAEILDEIPDPSDAPNILRKREAMLAEQAIEQRVVDAYRKVVQKALEYLAEMDRPKDVRLSLEETIRRALVHNYSIRAGAYDPAIEGTRLVEAEAAFDAEFFLDFNHSRQDSAFIIQTGNEQVESTSLSGGIRQLLPSGMFAQVGLSTQRNFIDNPNLPKRTNPTHFTTFTTSVTQPLLRGFGLEVNRSQIEIARVGRRIATWRFEAEVRDRLFEVEAAYWQLVQNRRTAGVLAVAVAQNYATYIDLWERRNHDASPVEIANSRSRWQSRYVDYLEAVRLVKDTEDALKNVINDPDLTLDEEIEIIPTDSPMASPVALDQFAEVRTALDERAEVRQAREAIESAKISTNVAKNQTLPQLDLSFNFESEGLDVSGDEAFDRLRNSEYISYAVAVNFSYPIGNRARESSYRRARLEEQQALIQLRQVIDGVVLEVNNSVRAIMVRYSQLAPSYEAVRSASRNLRSLQARASAISPNFLETELSAVESLTSSRTRLLGVLIDYNVSLIELERVKGTLLEYNNVTLVDRYE
jgi:outer membrane protein